MEKVFEKVSDFHNVKFINIYDNYDFECKVTDGKPSVRLTKDSIGFDTTLSAEDSADMIDFALSFYYTNENTTIEDGLSAYLQTDFLDVLTQNEVMDEDSGEPTIDDIPIETQLNNAFRYIKLLERQLEEDREEVKEWKEKAEKYSIQAYEIRKQLEYYVNTHNSGEDLNAIVEDLKKAIKKRNTQIKELEEKIKELQETQN